MDECEQNNKNQPNSKLCHCGHFEVFTIPYRLMVAGYRDGHTALPTECWRRWPGLPNRSQREKTNQVGF